MKKLVAIFAVCSAITFSFVGCQNNKESDDSSMKSSTSEISEESSKSDESSSSKETDDSKSSTNSEDSVKDESSTAKEQEMEPNLVDEALVGEWFSEDMNGSIFFDSENNVYAGIDYSSMMHFNSDKKFVVDSVECPVEYDGKTISITASDEIFGVEPETNEDGTVVNSEPVNFATLKKTDDSDSFDGEYTLESGEIFNALSGYSTNDGAKLVFVIDGNSLTLKINVCQYTADGKNIGLSGDGMSIMGDADDSTTIGEYKIDNDTLSLTSPDGQTVSYKKIS